MGVFPYDFEITSPVSPVRLFNALVVEADKVFPKAAPQAIKSVEIQGDGGPGTIIKINFAEGLPYQYVKHQVDAVDKASFSYNYSVIEGGPLGVKLEKISYENKFVAAGDGGTVCKSSMKFYTIGDCVFTEEDIKAFIQSTEVLYKGVEAYLLANPDVCN
ncbi:MLP-like protein 423 [Hibiscus trionum]|uniref:MLP-like protein 423 n=1 Tax=Hibiscus trionum TaxID=183268 RepID=A0A9W7H449_HIBTR|nr:MLP-like protein 423 [Hibiscus trionum]